MGKEKEETTERDIGSHPEKKKGLTLGLLSWDRIRVAGLRPHFRSRTRSSVRTRGRPSKAEAGPQWD